MLAFRLIALSKNPGNVPISFGEVGRRIIAKAVMSITRKNIQDSVGTMQLCAGQVSGVEVAIHAVKKSLTMKKQGLFCLRMLVPMFCYNPHKHLQGTYGPFY